MAANTSNMTVNIPTIMPGPGNKRSHPRGVVEKPKNMRGTLHRLWNITRGARHGLVWVLLFSALTSSVAVLSPLAIGRAVDAINKVALVSSVSPVATTEMTPDTASGTVLILLLGLYVGSAVVRFLQMFLISGVGQRIVYEIRVILFDSLRHLPLSFFDRRQHGELMSRLTNDVDNISMTISTSLSMLLTNTFTVVGIFICMVALSPLLTVVSLLGVGVISLTTRLMTRRTRALFKERQVALGALNGQIEESISGLPVVKAYCREAQMQSDFHDKNEALCRTAIKAMIWSGYLMPFMNVVNNLCFLAISVTSGMMAAHGVIGLGMISSFLLYIRQFTRPFIEIANVYNNFQTAVAGAERVFEIMDETPEPEDRPDALPLESTRGELELRHVSFAYESGHPILKDISLKIPSGTRVAVVGPTGSGKTTLISLLNRFYDVTDGEILLDGHDIREYKMADLRRMFSVVLQDTVLFTESVRDNIAYSYNLNSRQESTEPETTAKIIGASDFIERLPDGYDTVLTQGGGELSQGERQLITIARAIMTNAPILILDEATSSVDTVTEQRIRKAMLTACEGRTSFIIAHRLSTVRDADLILVMEDGQIIERGTHEELLQQRGHYYELWMTQTGQR